MQLNFSISLDTLKNRRNNYYLSIKKLQGLSNNRVNNNKMNYYDEPVVKDYLRNYNDYLGIILNQKNNSIMLKNLADMHSLITMKLLMN